MKHIGFLSFGHWSASPQSETRSAADALLQSIELAVAAEALGADGAYFRVQRSGKAGSSGVRRLYGAGAGLVQCGHEKRRQAGDVAIGWQRSHQAAGTATFHFASSGTGCPRNDIPAA